MTTIAAESSLPGPIRSYVMRYVRLHRRRALLRAVGIAAAVTIAWVLAACALDRAWPLPHWARAAMLSLNMAGVAAILLRPGWRWIRRDVDYRAAAADIEQRDQRFGQRLQTVTSQLLSLPQQRASAQLVAYLAGELSAELQADHPARLLPRRPVVRPWTAAAVLAAFAVALAFVPGFGLPTLLARYTAPFAPVAPPTTTQLTIEPRNIDLIEGQTVSIEAIAQRGGDGGATLHYNKPGQGWAELRMRPSRPQRFDAVLGPVDADIRYYVTAGDARSETYTVRVVKRPVVREFRIEYVYPRYLDRPPSSVVNTDGFIEAPVGTQVTVSVVASEPLASASLALGDRTLALTRGDDPRTFRGSFTVERSMPYAVEMASTSNVTGRDPTMRISAILDADPVVQLLQSPAPLHLHPRDALDLEFSVADDYGIAAMTVRATRTPGLFDFSAAQPNLALRRPTTQSSTELDAGTGFRSARSRSVSTVEAAVPISGDPRRQERRLTIHLAALGVQLGDRVTLSATATDTSGKAVQSEPVVLEVMPHSRHPLVAGSVDVLDRAAEMTRQIADSLQAAIARATTTQPSTAPLADIGRRIIDAAEQATALQPMLLGVVEELDGAAADAVASTLNAIVSIAAAGEEVYHGLGIDNVLMPADVKRLGVALEAAQLGAHRLAAAAADQRASGLLAGVRNVAALDAAAPVSVEHLPALRAAQQALRAGVEARLQAAEMSLDAADVQARLAAQIDALDATTAVERWNSDPSSLLRQLSLAVSAEARRRDGDPLRLSDLRRAAALAFRDPMAAMRLLHALQQHHAVRSQRARGGIVLLRGLWAETIARTARARLPALSEKPATNPAVIAIDRFRQQQLSLLNAARAGANQAAHLAAAQEELAAAIQRFVRGRHSLAWEGRLASDSRLEGVRAVAGAIQDVHAADPSPDGLLRMLEPFQPETINAMQLIEQSLRPMLGSKERNGMKAAVAKVHAALAEALHTLTADDSLVGAYAGAYQAAMALRQDVPRLDAAIPHQRQAIRALGNAIDRAAQYGARAGVDDDLPNAASRAPAPRTPRSGSRAGAATMPALPESQFPGYAEALEAYFHAIAPKSPAR